MRLVLSGNEIHFGCPSLSRLDFLGSLDLILIRFDLGGGCAAKIKSDENQVEAAQQIEAAEAKAASVDFVT